jgi:recombination protein U
MRNFEKQDGIAFILISYTHRNEFYYMRFEELYKFWKRKEEGGRKSFRYEELDERFFLKETRGVFIPYLEALQNDLELR